MPEFWQDLLTFNVDFNERDPDDARLVIASRTFSTGVHLPVVGERVALEDDEGNVCDAIVREVLDPTVMVEPIPGTFRHVGTVHITGLVTERTPLLVS